MISEKLRKEPQTGRVALRRTLPAELQERRKFKAIAAIISADPQVENGEQSASDFSEQVLYSGRRLAKLGVDLKTVLSVLQRHEGIINKGTKGILMTAYAEIREAEAQTFYDLARAESEATNLDDFLRRIEGILATALCAQAVDLSLKTPPVSLQRPRFLTGPTVAARLLKDKTLLRPGGSYWSIPLWEEGQAAGLIQLAFDKRYEWLPRELELLEAAGHRCILAAQRAFLVETARELAHSMLHVEERERRRISRELHDEAGQSLLFVRLQLELLQRDAPSNLKNRLKEIREVTEQTIVEIRRSVAALSPSVLEQLGLAAALRELGRKFTSFSGIRLSLRIPASLTAVPADTALVAYRLVQESLQNSAKHSGAKTLKLWAQVADELFEVRIEDDGKGFDPAVREKAGTFGLDGMQQRAALAGGSFEIQSQPKQGTRIRIRLPIRRLGKSASRENQNPINRRPHPVPPGDQDASGQ